MEGPSDLNAEVWEEVLDKDLSRVFYEHNWALEEMNVLCIMGARARGGPEMIEDALALPNPNDVDLIPRIDVDTVVGDNSEVSNCELQNNELDVYTLLNLEEMLGYDVEKAQRMKEAEKGYED